MDISKTILLLLLLLLLLSLLLLLYITTKKCLTSNKHMYPQNCITLSEIITNYLYRALQGLSGSFKEQYPILSLKSLRLFK